MKHEVLDIFVRVWSALEGHKHLCYQQRVTLQSFEGIRFCIVYSELLGITSDNATVDFLSRLSTSDSWRAFPRGFMFLRDTLASGSMTSLVSIRLRFSPLSRNGFPFSLITLSRFLTSVMNFFYRLGDSSWCAVVVVLFLHRTFSNCWTIRAVFGVASM